MKIPRATLNGHPENTMPSMRGLEKRAIVDLLAYNNQILSGDE